MKIKKEIDGARINVTLTSESENTFSFSYQLDHPAYLRFMSVSNSLSRKYSKLDDKDESKQGEVMFKLYEAGVRAIGNSTYDEILDFYDGNDEDLTFETMFSFITPDDLADELPKE